MWGGGWRGPARTEHGAGLWQVAGAYSRTWSHREAALLTLHKRLMETPVGTPKEDLRSLLRAAVFLIRRAIRDIVTPVSPAPHVPAPAVGGLDVPQEVTAAREAAWSWHRCPPAQRCP